MKGEKGAIGETVSTHLILNFSVCLLCTQNKVRVKWKHY